MVLPAGVTREAVRQGDAGSSTTNDPLDWSCPGSAGSSVIVCTTSNVLPRHRISRRLIVSVNVAGPPLGTPPVTRNLIAQVSGGGSPAAPAAKGCLAGIADCTSEPTAIDPDPAPFGIFAPSFVPDFFKSDKLTTERRASSHPDLLSVPFDFNSIDAPLVYDARKKAANESIRDIVVDLPPGFLGDPTAIGECSAAQFTTSACPTSSQVGRADVTTAAAGTGTPGRPFSLFTRPVYNLSHPLGSITDLAFNIFNNPVHVRGSLDPANRYAIRTTTADINETMPARDVKVTIWGVPADHSHDSERCNTSASGGNIDTSVECSTANIEPKPFLTVPAQCTDDNAFRIHHYDSWEHSGAFGPDIVYTMPGHQTECDVPRFDPSVDLNPTGRQANTPTGLDVSIQVPQNDNPNARATPPVKSTVVTFPEGMTLNPAFADGLDGCTLAQIGLGTNDPVACPDNSRIGEVFLTTPLLPERSRARCIWPNRAKTPSARPSPCIWRCETPSSAGSWSRSRAGSTSIPTPGRSPPPSTICPSSPSMTSRCPSAVGQRAPLVNPPTCGTHTIAVKVTSYAQPDRLDRRLQHLPGQRGPRRQRPAPAPPTRAPLTRR